MTSSMKMLQLQYLTPLGRQNFKKLCKYFVFKVLLLFTLYFVWLWKKKHNHNHFLHACGDPPPPPAPQRLKESVWREPWGQEDSSAKSVSLCSDPFQCKEPGRGKKLPNSCLQSRPFCSPDGGGDWSYGRADLGPLALKRALPLAPEPRRMDARTELTQD